MYAPVSIRTIPFIVHEAWKGNLGPFIDLYPKGKMVNDFIAEDFIYALPAKRTYHLLNQ